MEIPTSGEIFVVGSGNSLLAFPTATGAALGNETAYVARYAFVDIVKVTPEKFQTVGDKP